MRRGRPESFQEKCFRLRGVVLVTSVPLMLILCIIWLMPRGAPPDFNAGSADPLEKKEFSQTKLAAERWAVVFDCGSTGTRVHVYRFDEQLQLLQIGDELEIFVQVKPGLSSHAESPKQAADSMRPLMEKALQAVPKDQHDATPIFVGATAGLRLLPGTKADEILAQVRTMLKDYPFTFTADSVKILEGADEGAFAWVTVNLLLKNLGKGQLIKQIGTVVADTVGVIDLGGGSVQMSYALEDEVAKTAPEGYIRKINAKGQTWNVYVHSYLGYGLMAARAAVLSEALDEDGHSCLPLGYKGEYVYAGKKFAAAAKAIGGSFVDCSKVSSEALKLKAPCTLDSCSFNGAWSGGGGPGNKKLYVASYFFDRAGQLSVIPDPSATFAKVKPKDFLAAAEKVCSLPLIKVASTYPLVSEQDAPFACLDISYQATLLTQGFSIPEDQEITLVKTIDYNGKKVEAAWPLGAAVEALS